MEVFDIIKPENFEPMVIVTTEANLIITSLIALVIIGSNNS